MHTLIPSHPPRDNAVQESLLDFHQPHFECTDLPKALKLTVLVPGVEANGMEITTSGPDLIITAHKPHVVRVNWQSLHLEAAQHDYQLKLRLGYGFNFDKLLADLSEGILTIVAPKWSTSNGRHTHHPQLVA